MKHNLSANTFVVVVTYNPQIDLLVADLNALSKQFEHVMIVDNGSKNSEEISKAIDPKKIILRKLDKNMGIAYAQNVGLAEAEKGKFDWLLTMDQDSVIPDDYSEIFGKILKGNQKIGILGWAHIPVKASLTKQLNIISSGSITKIEALKKIGGYDDRLFIDQVDIDAALKIHKLGYETLLSSKVKLSHELGVKTDKKTLRGNQYSAHSPVRMYYIMRNTVVVLKRHFLRFPLFTVGLMLWSSLEGYYFVKFGQNKWEKIRLLQKARWHGWTNHLGEFNK